MHFDPQRLRAAIPEVKRRLTDPGWCQRAYFSGGRCCIAAAFYVALGHEPGDVYRDLWPITSITRDLDELLELSSHSGGRYHAVSAWNDAPHRTIEDVFELLDEFDKLLDIQIALETEK